MRIGSKVWKSLILMVTLAAVLAGCGGQASTDNNQAAKDQFLEERSAAPTFTPDPNAPADEDVQISGRLGMMGDAGVGVVGRVEKVEGHEITVSSLMDNTTTTVELTDDAKVYKQVDAQLSDIKVGDRITVMGQMEGDSLTAYSVQLGMEGSAVEPGGPGGTVMFPRQGSRIERLGTPVPGSDRNAPQNMPIERSGRIMPEAVFGTVEKVEGDKLTVKSLEGKEVAVQTGTDTTYQKRAEVDTSEITVGVNIVASGEKDGEVFKATQVQIIAPLTRQIQIP